MNKRGKKKFISKCRYKSYRTENYQSLRDWEKSSKRLMLYKAPDWARDIGMMSGFIQYLVDGHIHYRKEKDNKDE